MLINLRNALMGGKRLPYDAEVEYLKSSGTQWINTGYYPNNNTKLQYRCFSASSGTACGCLNGINWKPSFSLVFYTGVSPRWGTNANTSYTPFTWANVDITVEQDKDCYLNGKLVRSYTDTQFQMEYPLIVFDRSELNNNHDPYKGKVYYLKIFENGVLVRDYIPVRKGTTGELYDRVSGKFAERHGDFVLGPDVVPVEYIESHGTEWIDTGVLATYSDTVLDITIARSSTASNHVPVGARNAVYLLWINAQNVMLNYAGGNGASTSPTTIGDGFVRIVSTISKNSGSSIEVGGTTYTGSRTMLDTVSAYQYALFAAAATGESVNQNYFRSPAGERIAKAKISKDAVLVRDYKPIRVGSGSTWEGAMMDVLTRRIYRNAGTGAFTFGNDLKYPIPAS